jgi:SAM-dependent methyltransferase
MIEPTNPEIDVDQLMQRIREEVARRRSSVTPPTVQASSRHVPSSGTYTAIQPLSLPPKTAALTQKPYYELHDFLDYHDEAFIVNAYRGVLKREPDPTGLGSFLPRLRSGDYSKIEILGRLRFSPEGRKAPVRIKGLWFPFVVQTAYRLPLLGYAISWFNFVMRLPVLIKNLQRFEAHTAYWMNQQQHASAEQIDHINRIPGQLQHEMDHLVANKVDNIELDSIREQLGQRIEEKVSQHHLTELQHHLDAVLDIKANVADLAEARQYLHDALDAKANVADLAEARQYLHDALDAKSNVADLAEARQYLHDALDAKANVADLAEARQYLHDALDAKANVADLAEARQYLYDALDAKANVADLAEARSQLQILNEAKVEKSELTHLTNHWVSLLQTNTDAVQAKADQTALAKLHGALIDLVQAKADQAFVVTLKSELNQLRQRIQDQKLALLDNQRRLGLLLEEARKRLPAPLDSVQLAAFVGEADHLLDALYVTFEDRFRGDRADIKQRVTAYLPMIEAAQVGTLDMPIVDIGCGRGEWLELLKERGLTARGVDQNRIMVNECRERSFEVVEADALQYLRELPENSLGAVTGMHIIEHLPLAMLVALLDETLRVLKPGGVAIFETPNPENLVVGACNFYMDPTHRNPLPPPMIEYLVEARGFVRVEIRRWQQGLRDSLQFLQVGTPGAVELNPLIQMAKEHYFTAPDYAVIGYKA